MEKWVEELKVGDEVFLDGGLELVSKVTPATVTVAGAVFTKRTCHLRAKNSERWSLNNRIFEATEERINKFRDHHFKKGLYAKFIRIPVKTLSIDQLERILAIASETEVPTG